MVSKKVLIGFGVAVGVVIITLAIVLPLTLIKNEEEVLTCNPFSIYSLDIRPYEQKSYEKYAISSDDADCSTIGKETFEKGGSIIDVTIAVGICISVKNCPNNGIAGSLFMTIFFKEQNRSIQIDAREQAPIQTTSDMFQKNPENRGITIGIPGLLKGYHDAYKIGGKLPWNELFQPTIDLCMNGFRVSEILGKLLDTSSFKNSDWFIETWIDPLTNKTYKTGDIVKWPKLGNTLKLIADNGIDIFYNGSLTEIMVKEIQENGGIMTIKDFQDYQTKIYENDLSIRLNDDLRLYAVPPPSSGIIVAFILKIMSGFKLKNEKLMTKDERGLFYHRLVETLKHAYAKRSELGDRTFVNLDVQRVIDEIKDDDFIDFTRNKIDDQKTFPLNYYGSTYNKKDHGTTTFSVIGPNGDAVTVTATTNEIFGSGIGGKQTGILYNNGLLDFTLDTDEIIEELMPSKSNQIAPGKRPQSSMSPLIIVDKNDNVRLAIGGVGGMRIISSVSEVALRSLFMNTSIKDAIDSKRVYNIFLPNLTELESGFSKYITEYLNKIGHVTECHGYGSLVNGIEVVNGKIYPYSDPRTDARSDGK